MTCLQFDCAVALSDKDDVEKETSDEDKENELISEHSLTSPFLRKVAAKAKKRSLSRTSRDAAKKNLELMVFHHLLVIKININLINQCHPP